MKNLSAFLLVVAIGSGVCSAVEPVDVQNFEGEASVALSMPLGSYRGGHSEAGPVLEWPCGTMCRQRPLMPECSCGWTALRGAFLRADFPAIRTTALFA